MRYALASLALASSALVLPACGGSTTSGGGAGGSASAFAGTWSCTQTPTFTAADGGQMQGMPQPHVLVISVDANGALSVDDRGEDGGGGSPCTTTGTASGSTATFTANQTCAMEGGGYTITGGSANVSGTMLTFTVGFMGAGANGGSVSFAGTCTKQ